MDVIFLVEDTRAWLRKNGGVFPSFSFAKKLKFIFKQKDKNKSIYVNPAGKLIKPRFVEYGEGVKNNMDILPIPQKLVHRC